MANRQRYHQAGVGSRTGLTVGDDVESVDDYLNAALKHIDRDKEYDDDSEEEEQDQEDDDDEDEDDEDGRSMMGPSGKVNSSSSRRGRPSAKNSSSMDIGQSSALSPGTAYRRSIAPKPYSPDGSILDYDQPPTSSSRKSHNRKTNGRSSSIRGGGEDDDEDQENLGSRSFDLSAMAGDDARDAGLYGTDDEAEEQLGGKKSSASGSKAKAPSAGYNARKAAKLQEEEEAKNPKKNAVKKSKDKSSSVSPVKKPSTSSKKKVVEEVRREESQSDSEPMPQLDDYPSFNENVDDDDDEGHQEPMQIEQFIESDVGEEALERTTAGKKEKAAASKKQTKAKSSSTSNGKTKTKSSTSKAASSSKKGKGKETSSTSNGNGNTMAPLEVQKRTTKTKPGTNQEQIHREVVERVPSAYQRGEIYQDGFNEEGLRRGGRHRIAPLEFWRNERVVYGRPSLPSSKGKSKSKSPTKDGEDDDEDEAGEDEFEADPKRELGRGALVMKEIIRIPRAPGEGTFSGMKRQINKKSSGNKSNKKVKRVKRSHDDDDEEVEYEEMILDPEAPTRHPEDDWDAETHTHGVVFDARQGTEAERRIACTSNQTRPRKAFNNSFLFEKVFAVDEFMAAGVLEIPVNGVKPTKPSKDNNYTFVVVEGAVRVKVYKSNFIVAPGGMFLVPRGNPYSIENVSKRKVKLFFAQARNSQPMHSTSDTSMEVSNAAESSFTRIPDRSRSRVGDHAQEDEEEEEEEEEEVDHRSKGKGKAKAK